MVHSLAGRKFGKAWAISRSSLTQNMAFLVFSIAHKTINKKGRGGTTRLLPPDGPVFSVSDKKQVSQRRGAHSQELLLPKFSPLLQSWPGLQLLHEAFSWSSHRYSLARNFLECYLPCNLNSYFPFPFSISPHMHHFKSMEGSDL